MDTGDSLKGLFDMAPYAMLAVDAEGTIVLTNKYLEALFGYEANELIGVKLLELVPEIHRGVHERGRIAFMEQVKEDAAVSGREFVAKRKEGTLFFAEVTVNVHINGNERISLAAIKDVTERRNLYNQLLVSNQTFKGAFQYSAIGMALVSTDGKFIDVNDKLCEITGYSKDELLKIDFQSITFSDDLGLDLTHLNMMLEGKIKSYQIEKRYVHKSGSVVWVLLAVSLVRDINGNPMHFVSQIKDISARKKAEEELKKSEQRWLFALEGSGDGVWDWDGKSDTVFFSAQWKRMLGYSEDEIGDKLTEWSDRVHPEDIDKCYEDLNKHFRGETPIYINEHRLLCKDGTYKWILDRGKVIEWDEDGKPARVIGTHSDISLQKEKEKVLQQSVAIISEQNSRLMNFAHIVSHNLRSHSGNFQLLLNLLEDAGNDEDYHQMLGLLKDNAQSLDEAIRHLNEVVQIQTNANIAKQELGLRTFISKTIDVLAGEISKYNVRVINNVPEYEKVLFNPAYLESVLLNFISNGIKYRHHERSPEIELVMGNDNGKQYLSIKDNGIGINLEKYGKKLFGLYKTFHGNSDARGVGLFITKNQVDAMGGSITVESELNKGTIFKIYFNER
ncbi:MAG: PAS domain S-box protein [Bacteroidota bacterium]